MRDFTKAMMMADAAGCEGAFELKTDRSGQPYIYVTANYDAPDGKSYLIAEGMADRHGKMDEAGLRHFLDDLADPKTWASFGLTMPYS